MDSMWMWRTVLTDFIKQLNIPNFQEINDEVKMMTFSAALTYVAEKYDLGYTADELQDQLQNYILHLYKTEIQPKPYAIDYLKKLKSEGVNICLATLTDRHMVEAVLSRLDMISYFDYIITVAEIGKSKEYPDIYESCLRRFSTDKKDAVVFEDARYCLETASKAGFICYGVSDPWQTFEEGFIQNHCARFIESYQELL